MRTMDDFTRENREDKLRAMEAAMEICVTLESENLCHEHAHFGGNSCMSLAEMPKWLADCCEVYKNAPEWKLRISIRCRYPIS